MVRDGRFEHDEMPFMVVDVRTEVAKFVIEGIDLGKEAFFHSRQQSNMVGVRLGHQIGMAFLHIPKAFVQLVNFLEVFVQLVKQRSNKRDQFLILLTKDITNLRGGCDHSLVESVVGIALSPGAS